MNIHVGINMYTEYVLRSYMYGYVGISFGIIHT